MSLVLDASATLGRTFEEECSPVLLDLFVHILDHTAWVPGLWKLEVANILELSVRRRRVTAAFRDQSLADLATLPIRLDPETNDRAWSDTLRLAERHCLTIYDATYLELALRRDLPLATLDRELRVAAKMERVELLGL